MGDVMSLIVSMVLFFVLAITAIVFAVQLVLRPRHPRAAAAGPSLNGQATTAQGEALRGKL